MLKTEIEDAKLQQVMERAWLIMALISSALSDHPAVKSSRLYRRLTDRSRKALFDLHNDIEAVLLGRGTVRDRMTAKQERPMSETEEGDFGAEFLRLKGTVDQSVRLEIDHNDQSSNRRGGTDRKRRK